jgi:hypothetical protein
VKFFSGQYLLDPAGPSFHYVWPALLFFLLMGMIGTTYAYYVGETNNKRAPITRMSQRIQAVAWTLTVVGLLLIGFRIGDARIPLVGSRLILFLAGLGYVAVLGYLVYFLRVVLPRKDAAYQQTLLRRQYHPRPTRSRRRA